MLSNPLHIWTEGGLGNRRMLVRMMFKGTLKYDRKVGFGTTELSLPYLLSGHILQSKSVLVDQDRKTWNRVLEYILGWYKELSGYESGGLEYVEKKRPSMRRYPYRRKQGASINPGMLGNP